MTTEQVRSSAIVIAIFQILKSFTRQVRLRTLTLANIKLWPRPHKQNVSSSCTTTSAHSLSNTSPTDPSTAVSTHIRKNTQILPLNTRSHGCKFTHPSTPLSTSEPYHPTSPKLTTSLP
jgi:peroxiredoxin 5